MLYNAGVNDVLSLPPQVGAAFLSQLLFITSCSSGKKVLLPVSALCSTMQVLTIPSLSPPQSKETCIPFKKTFSKEKAFYFTVEDCSVPKRYLGLN
ncbi:hypothetical protein CEXT_228801 [Caerostris extrusa]|uniref:Uncharacterized protein n=1 Tax=Caerostris extrusa TaxID=172846 RepID=A0AAV4YCJ8_CAEEX|nr:hypothetical protein CEXT_228801 [Caerostris extrusa]